MPDSLFTQAARCLQIGDPEQKVKLTRETRKQWTGGHLDLADSAPMPPVEKPGRPEQPCLVHPSKLPRRTLAHAKGQAALIHAVTHIEFTAINLAWDAVVRYRDLPRDYYDDWIQVAAEEAEHFLLIRGRLRDLGYDYGDFPAHNGLWDMATRTATDALARMAMVPRVLEARGLDVTPGMIDRFTAIDDMATVACLEIILREEEGHVRAGSRWFHYLCKQRELDPEPTYFSLLEQYQGGEVRCPLHLEARRRAGFSASELARLESMCR